MTLALAFVCMTWTGVGLAQLNQTPKKKTAFIFAPHPSGQEPAGQIKRFLCAENYDVTSYAPGEPVGATLALLKSISTKGFAVLVIICHGSKFGLSIEDFKTEDEAKKELDKYLKSPAYAGIKDDIGLCIVHDPGMRYGIVIEAAGLAKLFGGADPNRSIIAVLACNSWNLQTENKPTPFGSTEFLGYQGKPHFPGDPPDASLNNKDRLKAAEGFDNMGGLKGIPNRPVKPAFADALAHIGPGNTTLSPASPTHAPADETELPLNQEVPGKTVYETEMSNANPQIMLFEMNECDAELYAQTWAGSSEHDFKLRAKKKGRLIMKTDPTLAVSKNNDNRLVGNRYRLPKSFAEVGGASRPAVDQCPFGLGGLNGLEDCIPPPNPLRWCLWCGKKPNDPGIPTAPSKEPEKTGAPRPPRRVPPGDRESFVIYQAAPESLNTITASPLPPNMTFQPVEDWYGHVIFTPTVDQIGQQYSVDFRSQDINGLRDSVTITWQVEPRLDQMSVFVPDSGLAAGDLGTQATPPAGTARYTFLVGNSGNTILNDVTISPPTFSGPAPLSPEAVSITPNPIGLLEPGDAALVTLEVQLPVSQSSGSYAAALSVAGQATDGPVGASASFALSVNRPVRILANPESLVVHANVPVVVPLLIENPDADSLVTALEIAPPGSQLERIDNQLLLYWVPRPEDVGTRFATIVVDDGEAPAVAELKFAVTAPPPTPTRRADAIWARTTSAGAITLDGVLDEPGWAVAESTVVRWGVDAGIPGSGWKLEDGDAPSAPLYGTLKFLRDGNQLYMAASIQDRSTGGSATFNRFDGLLMAIQDHRDTTRATLPLEYLYSWWWPGDPDASAVDRQPSFIGAWGDNPPVASRTALQVANWDARTVVRGHANTDAVPDTGYVVEMRFDVSADGYDFNGTAGDVVEFNIAVYDCDAFWPLNPAMFSSNRTWWQGPWGNISLYDEVRIFGRDDVRDDTGPVPVIEPDLRVPDADSYAAPVTDGELTEPVWRFAPRFDLRYGDPGVRASYPGVGPFRCGQTEPIVNGAQAPVTDPGDATVRYFFKGDRLYLGFESRDRYVQYHPDFDRFDGFLVSINDRVARTADQTLLGRTFTFSVGPSGSTIAGDDLPSFQSSGGAQALIHLMSGTTVDTLGTDLDQGFTAEMWIDLTQLGYPHGLGDGVVFLGVTLLDGDTYTTSSPAEIHARAFQHGAYGTRTYWFREFVGSAAPAWLYLDTQDQLLSVPERTHSTAGPVLLANYPNPFSDGTTLRYSLDEPGEVNLEVYDLLGRRIIDATLGPQPQGDHATAFNRGKLRPGLYLYRFRVRSEVGTIRTTRSGRLFILH